jgi:hypothetical protein
VGKGVHFVYRPPPCLRGHVALARRARAKAPWAYQSALLAVTFALAVPTSRGCRCSAPAAWTRAAPRLAGGALAALGFGLGIARESALCVLLGAVSLVLAVLSWTSSSRPAACRPSAGCCRLVAARGGHRRHPRPPSSARSPSPTQEG